MASNLHLERLHDAGVSIWLDTLSRELLRSGEFARLIRDYSVTGATSNPTIFARAITGSDLYDEELEQLASAGADRGADPSRGQRQRDPALRDRAGRTCCGPRR